MSPTEYLDQLDQAHEAAELGGWPSVEFRVMTAPDALPKLTAALRGCLRWADQLDREAAAIDRMGHDPNVSAAARDAAAGIRSGITHTLGGAA